MPRIGRIVLPNYPHHVVQRGHNRQVVFAAEQDYQRYVSDLRELKDVFGVKVYAYCLMTNHIHLWRHAPPVIGTAWKDEPVLSGKVATSPAWSSPTPTCLPAVVTSS